MSASRPAPPRLPRAPSLPPDFLWGAAWAAYEVEGNCQGTDLWAEEHAEGSPYAVRSGDASDHYHRWRDDFRLLAKLGVTAVRMSIEWSRIEPERGQFSIAALGHYREVLKACHACGITPIVCLHHLASPRWLIREGGWHNEQVIDRFRHYCLHVMKALGDWLPMVMPLFGQNTPAWWHAGRPGLPLLAPAAQATARWRQRAATTCGVQLPSYRPFWDADALIIEAVFQEAKETVRWLRPTTWVGRSWLVDATAQAPPPANADFVCIEYMGAPDTMRPALAALHNTVVRHRSHQTSGGAPRWWLVDHAAPDAGAANDPAVLLRALDNLQQSAAQGWAWSGWLYGAALDSWRGLHGNVEGRGLIAVERTAHLTRRLGGTASLLGRTFSPAGTGNR